MRGRRRRGVADDQARVVTCCPAGRETQRPLVLMEFAFSPVCLPHLIYGIIVNIVIDVVAEQHKADQLVACRSFTHKQALVL